MSAARSLGIRPRAPFRPVRLARPALVLAGVVLIAAGALPFAAVALGASSQPVKHPPMVTRQGIDVSHWNGYIKWRDVARAGIDFAIIKATEGRHTKDSRYLRNIHTATRKGILVTAYHYAQPHRGAIVADAQEQADFFLQRAHLGPTNLTPALDLEQTGHLGPKNLQRWTLAWLERVQSKLGVAPVIYTSPGFWQGAMANTRAVALAGYQVLWIAHWGTHRPNVPAQRWAGHGWTFWQWTKCGHVAGVGGCVDRDTFRGASLAALTIRQLRRK